MIDEGVYKVDEKLKDLCLKKIKTGMNVNYKGYGYEVVGINELKGEAQLENYMTTVPIEVKIEELDK